MMQIVIDISDDVYNDIKSGKNITDIIVNGTILPKGHGRLIDADAFKKKVCTYQQTGCGSCKHSLCCPEDAPTIIKADAETEWEYPLDYQIALDMAIASLKTQSDSNKCDTKIIMSIVLKTGEIINLNCDGYTIKDYNMLELYNLIPTTMTYEGKHICDGCSLKDTIAIFNIEDLCGFWMSEERCKLNE